MRTSGLVLDFYDDVGGTLFKGMFPTSNIVPDFVKQASGLSPESLDHLPDDAFALVMINGEEKLRKFACVDEGNTALSVLYFLKNAEKLPVEAQVKTAENLKIACEWYELDVPEELEKVAGLAGGAARMGGRYIESKATSLAKDPLKLIQYAAMPSLIKGTASNVGKNLSHLEEASHDAVAGMPDLHSFMGKQGELTGSSTMPLSASMGKGEGAKSSLAAVQKTAATTMGRKVPGHSNDDAPDPGNPNGQYSAQPPSQPQMKNMEPHVDVTHKEASVRSEELRATHYALGSRYPLDSYEQVKQASAYFEEYGERLEPGDRHEYCSNLVKRARDMRVMLPVNIMKYGSEKLASPSEFQAAIDMRRNVLDSDEKAVLLQKVAGYYGKIDPELLRGLLGEFDKIAGIDHLYDEAVYDPFYSTYGQVKTASDEDSVEEFSDIIGNLYVTGKQLAAFAATEYKQVKGIFGGDMANEFIKDPIAIYKSLPVDQKKMIIRMATENAPGSEQNI